MNATIERYTNEIILNKLIESCLNFDAKIFKPYLQSKIIITDMPDKTRFYKFFKKMLLTAKDNSIKPMTFKIEKPHWEEVENIRHYMIAFINIHVCV